MPFDASTGPAAATGRGRDSHTQVTTRRRPAHEDDRSEREPSEASPPESERFFRATFEQAVIGIAHISPGGYFLRFNQRLCDFLGYRPEELAVRTYQDVTHPDDFEPCMASFQCLLSGEIDEYAIDKRHLRKDGTPVWAHVAVSLVRTPEGAPDFTITMIQDIDERKRLEQERTRLEREREAARVQAEAARADELAAREASQRMEQFLAVAAHDLRTPLTAVVGYLALAERQFQRLVAAAREEGPALLPRAEAVRGRLADAGESVERLTRLLARLFDTTAARAGKLEFHRAPCDLAALVREQVATLRVAAPDRTISLRLPANGTPVLLEADAERLAEVVTNYLTNALKYSPPDQLIDVSVMVREGLARVAVRDRGPGLPKEEHARVWELYHRAPGVTVQGGAPGGVASGSLGLGLHISKAIVEAHGGRVGVESAVGEGSTFWFTLPLATDQQYATALLPA